MNDIIAKFYERDIRKLIDEIKLFREEGNLWKTSGNINNSAGNLALHIIGGTNFLIAATLANTGYVRNRDLEFSAKGVKRSELVSGLEALLPTIQQALNSIDLNAEYPRMFDDKKVTNSYLLVQLLAHLNYHLGQVNYLRRMLESE